MDGWNYRIIKRRVNDDEYFAIHEVYYENGKPCSCTEDPVYPLGRGSIENFKDDFVVYTEAFSKPILNYKDF